jgi:hypothetical protein
MPSRLGPPHPRPATLTFKPVRPSVVYSIEAILNRFNRSNVQRSISV